MSRGLPRRTERHLHPFVVSQQRGRGIKTLYRAIRRRLVHWAERAPLMLILALLFVGIIIWGAFNTALEATNTEQFCISCHEMRQNMYDSYLASPHYNNASGVSASCPDCHVPREWTRKVIRKISATNELYHHFTGSIDRPEKFRRKQLQLAKDIWQTMARSDSRECRNCHNRKRMALTNQSEKAALFHSYAEEKNRTCIHCHKGITHPLPQGYQDKGLEEDMKILHKRFEQQKVECHICHKGMAHSDW